MYGDFLNTDHGLLCTPDLVYCFFQLVSYSFQIESIKYMNSRRNSWLWILIQISLFPAILPWLPMMQLWAWASLFILSKVLVNIRSAIFFKETVFYNTYNIKKNQTRSGEFVIDQERLKRFWFSSRVRMIPSPRRLRERLTFSWSIARLTPWSARSRFSYQTFETPRREAGLTFLSTEVVRFHLHNLSYQ